jgi:hypothetical protein
MNVKFLNPMFYDPQTTSCVTHVHYCILCSGQRMHNSTEKYTYIKAWAFLLISPVLSIETRWLNNN